MKHSVRSSETGERRVSPPPHNPCMGHVVLYNPLGMWYKLMCDIRSWSCYAIIPFTGILKVDRCGRPHSSTSLTPLIISCQKRPSLFHWKAFVLKIALQFGSFTRTLSIIPVWKLLFSGFIEYSTEKESSCFHLCLSFYDTL